MEHMQKLLSSFTHSFQMVFNCIDHHKNLQENVDKLEARCKFLEGQLTAEAAPTTTESSTSTVEPALPAEAASSTAEAAHE